MPVPVWYILVILAGLTLLIVLLMFAKLYALWFQAVLSGAPIPFIDLIGMQFRKVDARQVILSRIRAKKAGFDVSTHQLEMHYLAGGNCTSTVNAMIKSRLDGVVLSWNDASAISLSKRDPMEVIQKSKEPILQLVPARVTPQTAVKTADGSLIAYQIRAHLKLARFDTVNRDEALRIADRLTGFMTASIASLPDTRSLREEKDAILKRAMGGGLDHELRLQIEKLEYVTLESSGNTMGTR